MTALRRTCAPLCTLAALLAALGCTQPQPLCQRAEVLQEVGRVVRTWNTYNAIDEYSVNEAPTGSGNSVVCHVAMTSLAYVPTGTGWQPTPYRESRRYDVQVVGNRFFVQVPPPAAPRASP